MPLYVLMVSSNKETFEKVSMKHCKHLEKTTQILMQTLVTLAMETE